MTANTLTTLAAVKNYLRITSSDTSRDPLLTSLIEAVSDAIETRTGRIIVAREIEDEPHDCNGHSITLEHYPVSEISSLMIEGVAQDLTKCTVLKDAGIIERRGGFHGVALVSYTAGYAADSASTPRDIQLASWKWIAKLFGQENQSVKSESLGDYSVTYYDPDAAIPSDVDSLLEPYRARTV